MVQETGEQGSERFKIEEKSPLFLVELGRKGNANIYVTQEESGEWWFLDGLVVIPTNFWL